MKLWHVITPEYEEVEPVTDEGQGPTYGYRDVIEIEAETRRDALVMGVALMRAKPSLYHWFRDWVDGNPYVGVRAELLGQWCAVCHGSGRTNNHVDGETECSGCEGTGIEEPEP